MRAGAGNYRGERESPERRSLARFCGGFGLIDSRVVVLCLALREISSERRRRCAIRNADKRPDPDRC